MLIELFGQNFGSFRDEFSLSLVATNLDPDHPRGVVQTDIIGDKEPLRLLRAAAIYGANGSGKSTIYRAARALCHLISHTVRLRSDSHLRHYDPFALNSQYKAKPVTLGVKCVIRKHVYEYTVSFDRKRFHSERLERINADEPTVLFDRQGQDVTGTWTEDDRFELLAQDFRPNALLLSLADRLAPGLAEDIATSTRSLLTTYDPTGSHFFDFNFKFGVSSRIAQRMADDGRFGEWLQKRVIMADLGIAKVSTKEVRAQETDDFPSEDDSSDETSSPSYELSLLHYGNDGPTELSFRQESLGTRRLLQMSPYLYDLAHPKRPMAVFVDELDSSLHPELVREIIRHVNFDINAKRPYGQMVFTTHQTDIIDHAAKDGILRRDQIYFTEKAPDGSSRLFSVADFKERNNLNIRKRYLQGRYGALPTIRRFED